MKYTKGTWEPERTGFTNESDMNSGRNMHKFIIKSDEPMNRRYGNKIANILGNESDAKANAHLIANAPEMLAMLKELCYKWIEKSNGGQKLLIDDNSINQELLHLIAKAEGGE